MESGLRTRNKIYYGWVIVITGLIISAVLIGSRQSFGVFFTSIETDFGLNRTATSGVFSVYMVLSAVFASVGGWALDRFGPRTTIAAMGLFTGAGLLITSQIHSVWQLYIVYGLLMAAGTGEAYTIVVGFVSRWFRKKRGLALGISTAGGGIGFLIYAPLASYLIISFDWRMALIFMGLIALFIIIGLSVLLKGYPGEMGLLPDGEIPGKAGNAKEEARNTVSFSDYSLREALHTRQFWLIFLVWVFQGIAVYIITTHIVPDATDAGIPEMAAATILSIISAFNIVGGLAAGALSDIFGRKALSMISALIGAGSLFWLTWIQGNYWLLLAFAALFGISWGGIPAIISATAGDFFGMRHIGTIIGAIGIAWFIGAAAGSLIGGTVFDIYQSYFLAFLIAAVCMLVVLFLLAILTRPHLMNSPHHSKRGQKI